MKAKVKVSQYSFFWNIRNIFNLRDFRRETALLLDAV